MFLKLGKNQTEHVKQSDRRDKKTQIKHLDIKIIMYEIKNTLDGINSRIGFEKKISKLEYINKNYFK